MKPGVYYITDPCYVLDSNNKEQDDKWQAFLDHFDFTFDDELDYLGHKIFVGSTAFGDGVYELMKRNKLIASLGVDAGLISILSEEFVKEWAGNTDEIEKAIRNNMATKVVIDKEFYVFYDGGNFKFAGYSIQTGGDE